MKFTRIAFIIAALLSTGSLAMATDDPITVNLSSKKHTTNSAAIEVSACVANSSAPCQSDPKVTSAMIKDRQFGVKVLNEVATPTLDDAIASIRRMPNVSLRGSSQTTSTVVVWDRRL